MFYRSKNEDACLRSYPVGELKQLQHENARLKQLAAEPSLNKAILQDAASKIRPDCAGPDVANYIASHDGVKLPGVCTVIRQARVDFCRSVALSGLGAD